MSLLPLFNFIEKEANKNVNIHKKLQTIAADILLKEQLECRNKELKNLFQQNLIECYTYELLAEQCKEDREERLNVERAAEATYATFFALCEEIKRFEFEKISNSDIQLQDMQMKKYVAEMEVSHEKESILAEKMNNRHILQKLRQCVQRNTESSFELAHMQEEVEKVRNDELEKLNALEKQRNQLIVNLLLSLKEIERLKDEKCTYQYNQGNIIALEKVKADLMKKHEELKLKQFKSLSYAKFCGISNQALQGPSTYSESAFDLVSKQSALSERPTLDDFTTNHHQATTEIQIAEKAAPTLKPILQKSPQQKRHSMKDETQTKQVHFLLPETTTYFEAVTQNFEEALTQNTNEVENSEETIASLIAQNEQPGQADTANKLYESLYENEEPQEKRKEKVEILECITLAEPFKCNDIADTCSNSFNQPLRKPNQQETESFFNELAECSADIIPKSSEDIKLEQINEKNQKKSKLLNNQNDFEKFLLMNTLDEMDDSNSQRGGSRKNDNEKIETEDLFFGTDSMMTGDCIGNNDDKMMFDLSGSDMESNANDNNNFF